MNLIDWKRGALASSLGIGLACFAGGTPWTKAEEAPRPPAAPRDQRNSETRTGRVETLLRNGHDDVDGLRLEGGQEIHFPPHMGVRISRLIKTGDQIEVQGSTETRPRGEVVFEASELTSHGETVLVERPRPPYGPKGPRGPKHGEEPMNVTATVKSFATNPHGDVDGLVLSDGSEVKLPPHQGRALQDLLKIGDEVRVEGRRHETPRGDIHLHADRITAVASGSSIERDGPGPGRGRHAPPHERGRGDRDAGPDTRHAPPPPHAAQFDEILRELREVRRLLETQQKN